MDSSESSGFKKFYTTYYNKCFLFAKSYVHDDWIAEDIASESLIKLWEIGQLKEIEHPGSLLFTILKNKALDHLNRESIRQNVILNLSEDGKRELEIRISTLKACDPEKIFADDIRQIIASTLSGLPRQTREIFFMHRFQNLSKKEISEAWGISIKGVNYHLSKTLKHLRANLADYFPILFLFLTIRALAACLFQSFY
ncbi:MAG: RNA polymerase sigma-70 factor [Tannerellaceae bacterium]|jgi:RNA polymerase sigma-70 factor (ECF subfamily)|nr:RNA polymerase sigma-70 factor [Tannerellaceae bacterium]